MLESLMYGYFSLFFFIKFQLSFLVVPKSTAFLF